MLFSGGVAIITFVAFMAGFSYRQRQLSAENAAIRYLALHDELTGLPNRKQFEDFMARSARERRRRSGHKAALFVLDLDGFKAVNDTLGHPVGDGLLKACAKRLKASLRGGDLLARLSGDEFVIVVPKVTDPAMLAPLAERVLNLLSSPFRVDGHEIAGRLLDRARGRARQRRRHRGADAQRRFRALSRQERGAAHLALLRSEDGGGPRQPAHAGGRPPPRAGERPLPAPLPAADRALERARRLGYEAMLRWRLPGKGLVPASVFVSIAEETGLVVPIGEWVIRQAARDCALIPAGPAGRDQPLRDAAEARRHRRPSSSRR